ncbi:MAG: hypothetical protein ABIV51_04345 [Saprospiraceae bacterium]
MCSIFSRLRIFISITLLLLGSKILLASGIPPLRHFTPEDYKGQYQNWMLSASQDGRLFAANSAGMMYYDGLNWFLHPLPNKQVVRSILYQSPDRVFTGAYAEFGYWAINNEHHWQFNSLSELVRDSIFEEEEIWHITRQDSLIWFQSFSRIYRFDGKRIDRFLPPGNIMFVEPYAGKLLVPVIGKGLYQLDKKGQFSAFPHGEIFINDRIVGLSSIKGNLWVSTEKRGIFIWDGKDWKAWNSPANEELKAHTLNKALFTEQGPAYLGTIDAGVLSTDLRGEMFQWINKQDGLQNNTVLSICTSSAGHVWLGLDEGIDAIINSPGIHFQVEKEGKIGTCYAFAHHKGKFYAGTNQGLFVADSQNIRTPKKLNFSKVKGVSGQVWYLSTQEDQLIVGHNDGTGLVEGDYVAPISNLSGGWCIIHVPDKEDHLIEGTYSGISNYAFEENRWVLKNQMIGFKQPVKKLIMDRLGNLWALHPNKGLFWIKCTSDFSTALEVRAIDQSNRIPHPYEMDIMLIDSRLIVRSGGLYFELNPATRKLNPISSIRGIAISDLSQQLIGADRQGLWFSGNGEFRWDSGMAQETWPVKLIDRYETLLTYQDYLLAGVHNGFVLLDLPSKELGLHGREKEMSRLLAISPMDQSLDRWIVNEGLTEFALPKGVNSVRLWFAKELLDVNQELWFHIGDKDWQKVEGYVLDLPDQNFGKAKLAWKIGKTGEVAHFEIEFVPHWYQHTMAKFLYLLLAIGLLVLFFQLLKSRFYRQQKTLDWENQQRFIQQQVETENALLQADLTLKSRELALSSQALLHKNAILTDILEEVQEIKAELGARMPEKHYRRLENLIQDNIESEHDRQVFELNMAEVNNEWLSRLKLKFTDLTPGDLRLAAYLKMNLSSKEIAPLLGISIRGVENKRYRLRYKMGVTPDDNIIDYLLTI